MNEGGEKEERAPPRLEMSWFIGSFSLEHPGRRANVAFTHPDSLRPNQLIHPILIMYKDSRGVYQDFNETFFDLYGALSPRAFTRDESRLLLP